MTRKTFTAFFALLLSASILLAASDASKKGAELGKWTMDFDAAKALADKEQKPMLLNFSGSDWCGWCKLMEKNVFSQQDWKDYAKKNLVMVLIDFPNDKSLVPKQYVERNEKLQERFGVQGFPTFVYLDCDGETELGRLGAGRDKTPKSFIQELAALSKFCASELERYTRTLSAKDRTAYMEIVKDMKAREMSVKDKKALIAAAEADIEQHEEAIAELKDKAQEFRVSKQGKEAAEKYKSLQADMDKAEQEMKDWMASKPERNAETMKKFQAMAARIAEIKSQLAEY